jgi:SAM-dependent methyltransferase
MTLLQCLKCSAKLDCGPEQCVCPKCRTAWPVRDGIPRFFQVPDHYWGEMGRNDALQLIDVARKRSWVEAVRARFPENDNMFFGLLDPQRASWAPMLGLDEKSLALDIGSGYGCITQSLSRFVGEVYSVEAVTERIDFTRERLRQERVNNVRLVQASAADLPLADNSFDLVVVNGVLEWVGEWDLTVDPRTVQINFLKKIFRLLKDDGILLVGIENRIGWTFILGEQDHSGMPYTTLVPRAVASWMLRLNSKPHFRTELNPRRQYRTYTYSERGYRKLLGEVGFAATSSYWAEPGYNQPYSLIPLARPDWVRQYSTQFLDHPGPAPRRSWRRRLKRVASPISPWLVPDFVLLASKQARRRTRLQTWVDECLAESAGNSVTADTPPLAWALRTRAFNDKSIVRLGDATTGSDLAYLKICTGNEESRAFYETEITNRTKVRDSLNASGTSRVLVPRSYGTLQIGITGYHLEAASRGTQIAAIVHKLGYFENAERVEHDLSQICDRIIELTTALQNISGLRTIPLAWREIPETLRSRPDLARATAERRYFQKGFPESSSTWIQHGDLSVENAHLNQETGEFEVFDWCDLAGGLPPLYDLFQFFFSTGYLSPAEETVRYASEEDRWVATFKAVFLSDSSFGRTTQRLILRACERLSVSPEDVPSLLLEFLIVRSNYYRPRSEVQRRLQVRLLELCVTEFERLQSDWKQSEPSPPRSMVAS